MINKFQVLLLSIFFVLTFFSPAYGAESKEFYECLHQCKDKCDKESKDEMGKVKERGGDFSDRFSAGLTVALECKSQCDSNCDSYK
jgi:hypothetical protein